MEKDIDEIVSIRLHPDARTEIKERTRWFVEVLTAQSKVNARRQNQSHVHKDHVERAFNDFTKGWAFSAWYWDVVIGVGGLVVGIGVPGFIQELQRSEGIRAVWITVYTIASVVGILAVVFGGIAKRT
jgi:hypothetical protein